MPEGNTEHTTTDETAATSWKSRNARSLGHVFGQCVSHIH